MGQSTPATGGRGPSPSLSSGLLGEPEVAAFVRQANLVLEVLDKVIDKYVSRGESVVVEGVHLLPSYCVQRASRSVETQNNNNKHRWQQHGTSLPSVHPPSCRN